MNNRFDQGWLKWRLGMFVVAAVLLTAIVLCLRQFVPQPQGIEPNSLESAGIRVGEKASSLSVGPLEERTIPAAIDGLTKAGGPEAARSAVVKLREKLSGLTPQVAAPLIVQILDSRVDAATEQDLAVGPDGSLKASPSLRVFLLDYLAQADAKAAAAYAERVLESFSTPDEWAVSLRNYARANDAPQGRAFLRQKLEAMLR